jgi:hypothetical protein
VVSAAVGSVPLGVEHAPITSANATNPVTRRMKDQRRL